MIWIITVSRRRNISCGRAKIKISPYQVASCMYFYHIKQEYSTASDFLLAGDVFQGFAVCEEINILKIGLSGIVKRYGYQNVQEFYRIHHESHNAYVDYKQQIIINKG